MHQKNTKPFALRRLMLAVILFLMCVIIMVGVTWARYQAEDNSYLKYNTREPAVISLWSGYDPSTDTLIAGDRTWTFSDGMGTLCFYISNSSAQTAYSGEDQSVSIRLMGTLGIRDAQVSISVSDGSSTDTYIATPVQIKPGTPLYSTFGGGNTYVFQSADGVELSWDLDGGALSVLSVQIDVWNLENIENAALLQLQVVGK